MKYLPVIITAFCLYGCAKQTASKSEKPLARVFDNYLYPEDIKGIIASDISDQDSISIVNNFVEKWISNQLMLHIAEINLTDQEKDVARQIENYRTSLLIYAYQQRYLQDKLDTLVNDEEIEGYYNENQANFILNEPMMKGLFIKLPLNSPEIFRLRQWYRSDKDEDLKNLEAYCFAHAEVYDHFNEGWVNVNEVVRMIPADDRYLLNTLKNRKYIEIRDQNYYYFVYAKDLAFEGNVTPFELVKNNIHSIILNKRKIQVLNELESNILSDAQNREQFTIYK